MPIYEYRCMQCSNTFSHLWLRLPEAGVVWPCPACKSEQTQRAPSLFALKGKNSQKSQPASWPKSWKDTHGADPETISYWRRRIESEAVGVEHEPSSMKAVAEHATVPNEAKIAEPTVIRRSSCSH